MSENELLGYIGTYTRGDSKGIYRFILDTKAANRGHNSIAIFRVNQDLGKLTFIETVSTKGDWPRDFVLDPAEKFMVVSNEKSNNLVLFSRNETTR